MENKLMVATALHDEFKGWYKKREKLVKCSLLFNKKGEFMVSIGKMEYYPTDQGPLKEWDYETGKTVSSNDNVDHVAYNMCAEIYDQIEWA